MLYKDLYTLRTKHHIEQRQIILDAIAAYSLLVSERAEANEQVVSSFAVLAINRETLEKLDASMERFITEAKELIGA